jgi:hypothetical protein
MAVSLYVFDPVFRYALIIRHVLLTGFEYQHCDNPFSAYARGFAAFAVDEALPIAAANTLKINMVPRFIRAGNAGRLGVIARVP